MSADQTGSTAAADPRPGSPAPDRTSERLARILIWLWSLSAVVLVVMWVLRLTGPLSAVPVVVLGTLNLPVTPSLASVVLVSLLAAALQRRMRIALWAAAVCFAGGGALSALALVGQWELPHPRHAGMPLSLHVLLDVLGVVFAVLGVAVAVRARRSFPARTRPGSVPVALLILAAGVLVSLLVMQLLTAVSAPSASWDPARLRLQLAGALGLRGHDLHTLGGTAVWIDHVGGVLLAASLLAAVWTLFRSGRRTAGWTGDTEVHLHELLHRHGEQDSLGWFATRRDKEVVFSDDGRAAVAFRALGGTCLASGDPVGDPHSWPSAIAAWRRYAAHYGLAPAALSASERGARAYASADQPGGGMAVTAMGDEAVLDADRFTLSSTDLTDVRRAVRRARRSGATVSVRRHHEVPAEELAALGECADRWRGDEPDRGFSMALNRWGDPADAQSVLVVASDAQGAPAGLLSLVPWGRRGLSLDVMRHDSAAVNGVSELMIAELMAACGRLGVRRVSLNFAMFRSVFDDADRLGAGVLTRFNSGVLTRLDRVFQLERLYRFNDRFRPEWVTRYAVFESLLTLPRVALAAGAAEGFMPQTPWDRRLSARSAALELSPEQLQRVREIEARRPSADDVLAHRARRLSPQRRHRRENAAALAREGQSPWPVGLHGVVPLHEAVASVAAGAGSEALRTAGRVRGRRDFGGVVFLDLVEAGARLQVAVERDAVDGSTVELVRRRLDIGDLLVVDGRAGVSRTGTPVLLASRAVMGAKALRELPFEGFEDPEARLRDRSLDLIVHPDRLDLLRTRTRAIRAVRHLLEDRGLSEVETPVLNTVHGGASARPFRTWINAYGMPLSLRIAPELFLKRLLVGGMGPLFEIARNFRNEGADATHNPEFTALEAYVPWADYQDMRELTQDLVRAAATAVHGRPVLPLRTTGPDGRTEAREVDLSGSWAVRTVTEAVSEAVGRPVSVHSDIEELLGIAAEHDVPVGPAMGPGAVLEELYGELVEPATIMPTFYCDFPAETSPLTAPHRTEAGLVERWDLVIGGMELGTAYSEMTDPVVQRRRLTEQSLKAAAGDPEAMEVDEDFLAALELGMPPAGGLGIGLDRLVMLLSGTAIRDVLAFPFVRPLG